MTDAQSIVLYFFLVVIISLQLYTVRKIADYRNMIHILIKKQNELWKAYNTVLKALGQDTRIVS